MKKLIIFPQIIILIILLSGCQTIPKDALKLSPTSLKARQQRTRTYSGTSETHILGASIGVLQDLGFNITNTDKRVGLLVGQKKRDATNGGQIAAAVLVALLGGGSMPVDKEQVIRVSIVTSPSDHRIHKKSNRFDVRVTFQRIIWNTQNKVTKAQAIKDPKIYQSFFNRLEQSLFLEKNS